MKYEYLVIDMETKDPFLGLGLGAGWPYNNRMFKVLGMSVMYPDGTSEYITNRQKMKRVLGHTDKLIVFNADYDIGIIHSFGIDIREYEIIDVLVMARLYNSIELEYSLNFLSRKYLKDEKSEEPLGDAAKELGLVKSKTQNAVKVAKQNMEVLQEKYFNLVEEYAIHDVRLTYRLYEFFEEKGGVPGYDVDFYSDLIKALLLAKARGVRIDLIRLNKLSNEFGIILMDEQLKLNAMNDGEPVNVGSPKDVPELLLKHGVKLEKNNKTDNYICDKHVLENLNNEVAQQILKVRKIKKLKNDFIDKIADIQQYTIGVEAKDFGSKALFGVIYPTITIAGASNTGRSSSSGPNIQQIPKRGDYAKLIRSIVVPEAGDKYICAADFSAQEPRLIINDAARIKADGIDEFVLRFNKDPESDFHSICAKIMGVERSVAKTIGLGLLYGMGDFKLSVSLNVDIREAKRLKELYFERLPFMQQLIDSMQASLKRNKYISTIGGNRLRQDKPKIFDGKIQDFAYKALNKRIQGSAAYQTNKALVDLYRNDIEFIAPIHDEIIASVRGSRTAKQIQRIMEDAYKLCIPSVAEPKLGENWSDVK